MPAEDHSDDYSMDDERSTDSRDNDEIEDLPKQKKERKPSNRKRTFFGLSIEKCNFNSHFLGYHKSKRPKEEFKTLYCPYVKCLKSFSETGNLKTHIRTHVHISCFKFVRLESAHFRVPMKVVQKALLRKDTLKPMS